jgi:hypothetical protein
MSDIKISLDALGIKHGTDKSSTHHNYLALYERYFAAIRENPITFLEIGILEGKSLRVWRDYFVNGTIVGADIDTKTTQFSSDRVFVEILDQSNIEHLVLLGLKYGPFDVIIEDGSHMWEHQITSLRTLFPFLRNDGVYIVEDLQTNFGGMKDEYRGTSSITCVDYLKKLVDLRVADDQTEIAHEEDAFLRTYGRSVNTITFYRRACVIEKKMNSPRLENTPYFAVDSSLTIPVFLTAHIGNLGDRTDPFGCIRSVDAAANIQGFVISAPESVKKMLSYKARLANGSWTDWQSQGDFAGTRALEEDLTGFSVRLDNDAKEGLTLQLIGEFRGIGSPIVTEGGAECVSPIGASPLCGMQVVIHKAGR